MNGKLIVVTGIDGSGKTVQSALLTERLKSEGYDVEQLDFPQYGKTFFADLIARYLSGDFNESFTGNNSPKSVNPYFTSLLYAGDRWETVGMIKEWLNSGKIVISNRYTCCNKAYQGAKIDDENKRQEYFKWVDTLEHKVYGIPQADKVVFLHNDIDIALDLINKRQSRQYFHPEGKSNDEETDSVKDIHEQDTEFLRTVQKRYIEMASVEDGWAKVECVKDGNLLTKEIIADEIWSVVSKVLNSK